MSKDLIEKTSTVKTTAVFSKSGADRYLLKYEWDDTKKSAVIIMSMPSVASELLFDQTTMLCRNGAVKNGFGSISIVNLTPAINNPAPKQDKQNASIIMEECEKADCIIVAFGRGTNFLVEKEAMLNALSPFEKKLYTLIDLKGQPFSHPLSPYAHEWLIRKL